MEYVLPIKIVDSHLVHNAEALLVKKEKQVLLNEKNFATVDNGGYIILDFGAEYRGGIRVITHWFSGKVRIRFGESLPEVNSDIGNQGATNDHAIRDFEYLLATLSDVTVGDTGFRYVRIDFYYDARVTSVYAATTEYKGKPVYEYNGDDKLVKDIFNTAKRTVDLCASSDYVWDGVKRDRIVWFGDLHPETLALASIYGKCLNVERSLDLARRTTPMNEWMNGFPSYSMWWVITVYDYLRLSNRRNFALKQIKYLERLVNKFDKYVDEEGEMHFESYFTDWPTRETPQEKEGVRAIFIAAMNAATKLFEEFGVQNAMPGKILEKLYKKEIICVGKKQIIGLKYIATGKITESEKSDLIKGGAEGLSTFMSYYILTAIASFDKDAAVAIMKEYYGKMLELGATTFWEDFDIKWADGNVVGINEMPKENEKSIHSDFGAYCYLGLRHSLCHGWSAGVVAFIKENLG